MNINLKEKIKNVFLPCKINKNYDRNAKQAPILGLLFISALSLIIPTKSAHALSWPWEWSLPSMSDIGKSFLEALLTGFNLIVYNIGNFALNIAGQLVHFGAWLVDLMMDQTLYRAVLVDSSAIKVGWETIRDFCNMFFIFFLLIVAFATILRISEYGAKAILPKFLIAIFMINFSMEIAKLVIDFGQVFMYEIKGWMGDFSGTSGGGSGLTSIVDYFNDYFNASANLQSITTDSSIAVLFAAAYSFMLGFTYIMLAGFLLVRLLMFAVLIILSPFAFFCNIFPGTRRYAGEWWGSIVKYSLFGPIFIFFVFISATMAFELTSSFSSVTVVPSGYNQIEAVKGLIPKLIPNIVALMMLWMAIPITQKLGIAGSSRLIGGTLGLGTVAMASYGATKLAGGWGKKIGVGTAERYHASSLPGAGSVRAGTEKLSGWLKTKPIVGSILIKNQSERAKEKEKDAAKHEDIMKTLSSKDRKIYVDNILDPKAKAAAEQAHFNLLAKDSGKGLTTDSLKEIDIDEKELKKRYAHAKIYGHDTSKLEQYRPDLLEKEGDIKKQVQKIVADGNQKNIKSSALINEHVESELRQQIGDVEYDRLIENKPQIEKDEIIHHTENKLATKVNSGTSVNSPDIVAMQASIAKLASSRDILSKMKDVQLDAAKHVILKDGKIQYNDLGDVNSGIANKVIGTMTNADIMAQSRKFFEDAGQYIGKNAIKELAKKGQTEKLQATREAIVKDLRVIMPITNLSQSNIKENDLKERLREIDSQL